MRKILKTERLVLRPLTLQDAKALSTLGGEKDVARMTGSFPLPFPEISAEFWIMTILQRHKNGMAYPYVVTQDGGELMGVVDIFRREKDGPIELGYWMGKPYWGKGFMREACVAVIAEAKAYFDDAVLMAGVFVDNPRSLSLLLGLGFKSLETYQNWFSMARLEKARGVELSLNLRDQSRSRPLRQTQKMRIRA